MKRCLSIFLLSLAAWCCIRAQTPVFRPHPAKELEDVQMNCQWQDSRGWLWFGAREGLFRYDGLTFQSILIPDSGATAGVSALYEKDGMLWVGFQDGQIGLVPIRGVFSHPTLDNPAQPLPTSTVQWWKPEEGTPTKPIMGFAEDPSGGFWIATYGEGLYCWKNERLYQFDSAEDGLAGDDIYALACDARGTVWAATDGGISCCTMSSDGHKEIKNISTAEGLPDEIVTALQADAEGNIWIGTYDHGVCHYHVAKQRFDYVSENWTFGPVHGLTKFANNEIWVGTDQNGPVRVDLQTGIRDPVPDGHPLRHSKVVAINQDREGWLWVLADKGMLYSANTRFGTLNHPIGNVQAICADDRNQLWAGTPEGLFLCRQNEYRQVLPGRQNVLSLWRAPDGQIWAGTFGNGAFVLDPQGKVLRHVTERDGLANGSILSIAGDDQRVWLATLGGVNTLDQNQVSRPGQLSHQGELGSHYVYKVFIDRKKRVWFGTDGKGLSMLENGVYHHYREANGLTLHTVYAITEDRAGNIWFSTDRQGLYRFDGQTFQRYTKENHLHSLNITGLEMDIFDQVIIAYDDGIDVLTPATGHVFFWDASTGAPAFEVNLNALCRDRLGNVWIGAHEGVVRLAGFGDKFLIDPQPDIVGVSVFLQPVDFLEKTGFAYDQNYFIFNFIGLWYTKPDAVRYRYRLEGFDPDWKISKDHIASYPNLPPGQYVFRVQTSEHGNFDQVPETAWSFTIATPFWSRWWFVTLCLGAASALYYWWMRNRDQRLRREALLKKEKLESQFAALKSQINPHFLFNSFNTLITIIEENPNLAVEYVEHLSDFYRTILIYREKDLISLQEEISLVRNFTYLLQKRYENNFRLHEHLNGHAGLIMPLTLQILVENAVKHNIISAARPLLIQIFIENDDYVVVRNNIQPKIKPEPGTHFGLQSLIHRYELLGERPVIVEEQADFFTVKVPLL